MAADSALWPMLIRLLQAMHEQLVQLNVEQRDARSKRAEELALLNKIFALQLHLDSTLRRDNRLLWDIIALLRRLLELEEEEEPKLAFIRITLGGEMPVGPVTLNPGQSVVATVLGFDASGAPFPIDFAANPVTWTLDNPALDTLAPGPTPADQTVTYASAGTANLTATCAGLTDVGQVINAAAPASQLASIKVSFAAPTP